MSVSRPWIEIKETAHLNSSVANLDEAILGSWQDVDAPRVLAVLAPRCTLPGNDWKLFWRVLFPQLFVILVDLEGGNTPSRGLQVVRQVWEELCGKGSSCKQSAVELGIKGRR